MSRSTPTIGDVANEVGCSRATVSLALNNRPGVSVETRKRVCAAAESLGYQPNLIARKLYYQKTSIVGVLFHDVSGPFMPQVLRGISDVATQSSYSVLLSLSDRRLKRERELLELLEQEQVDGIILCSIAKLETGKHLRDLQKRTPLVLVDRYLNSVDADHVVSDSESAAHEMTAHMIQTNHRRVAIALTDEPISPTRERIDGYQRALGENGLPYDTDLVKAVPLFTEANLRRQTEQVTIALDELMALDDPPTCLLSMNSDVTLATIVWARARGLAIPEDLELAAFDQMPLIDALGVQIPGMVHSPYEMGAEAARLLFKRIEGDTGAEGKIRVPVRSALHIKPNLR